MADKIEIVNDLTPEQLREATEPKLVTIGNEEEIEQIKQVFDTELLPPDDDTPPAPTSKDAATPPKASASPAETLEIDGQQVLLSEVRNRYKFWSATNQRAAQVAADRRRIEDERAQFERDRKAADDRIASILEERLPPKPVPKPDPISIDLSDVPDVDNTTLEGQEQMKDWVIQVASRAATAARDAALKEAESRLTVAATPPQKTSATETTPLPDPVRDHNIVIEQQFFAPEVLAEFGIDQKKALDYTSRMAKELYPNDPYGRWTLNEVLDHARRFQMEERTAAASAARAAEEAAARRNGGAIKRAADASDVVRGGGAPAQRSLKVGDVLSMPVEELRRRVAGPMKGRGGPQAYGTDPLYRTWEEMEKIS